MEMKKKVLLSTFVIFIVGLMAYITIPFPKFEQIHIRFQELNSDEKIIIFLDRLWAYNNFSYVYKGASFNELQCYSHSKEGGRYNVSIKFNWDNTITVSENEQEITLNIDSIAFKPLLSYGEVPDLNNDDYFYECISFFDEMESPYQTRSSGTSSA